MRVINQIDLFSSSPVPPSPNLQSSPISQVLRSRSWKITPAIATPHAHLHPAQLTAQEDFMGVMRRVRLGLLLLPCQNPMLEPPTVRNHMPQGALEGPRVHVGRHGQARACLVTHS